MFASDSLPMPAWWRRKYTEMGRQVSRPKEKGVGWGKSCPQRLERKHRESACSDQEKNSSKPQCSSVRFPVVSVTFPKEMHNPGPAGIGPSGLPAQSPSELSWSQSQDSARQLSLGLLTENFPLKLVFSSPCEVSAFCRRV